MNTKYKNSLIFALFILLLSACAPPPPSTTKDKPDQQVGYASWYGGKFHGRKTASGETYDQDAMTAAHKYAPFGALVRVTNLENGKSTIVKINDRGPFVEGRIIDLSREAARKIDMLQTGIAKVRLNFLSRVEMGDGSYKIQAGSYKDQENAQMQKRDILAKFPNETIQIVENNGFFRVMVGPFAKREDAEQALNRLRRSQFDGFILQF